MKRPEIVFVPPRMDLYLRFSRMAKEIYEEYTDMIEPYGIDEAWLDITGSSFKGNGLQIAREISDRIKYELGVTVSIGISWNKIFAKLGSDYKKPDAITSFNRDNYKNIVWKLPVSDLLYVGRKTNEKLRKLYINTIGDLANTDKKILEGYPGKCGSSLWLYRKARQQDSENMDSNVKPWRSQYETSIFRTLQDRKVQISQQILQMIL